MAQQSSTLSVAEKIKRYQKVLAMYRKIDRELGVLEKRGKTLFGEVHEVVDREKMQKVLKYIDKTK